jgi:tetratricopeptide (TPR) repeat protein
MVRPATATAPIAANPERVANLLVQARELARRATNLRDFEQVMQLCHEAIACGPTPQQADSLGRFAAWVSNARGELLLKAGNEFDAFEAFQEAVLLDADCWEALHNRGVTLAANQKPQEALADFARVIELAPRFGSVFRNRGELYTSLGQPALAVDDFSRAIQLEPRIPEHRIARAKAHVDLNHLAEAVQDLTAALQANPQLAEALAMRANIYYTLGYWEQAIDDYQQALRLQPRSLSAYQGLAWMLATCPDDKYRHADKALESATRALKLGDASDARLLDTVAAAYAEAGDFAQAVKFAQQAVVMGGDSQSQAYRSRLELYRQGQPFRSPQLP